MSAFSALRKTTAAQATKPQEALRVVIIQPTAFASAWSERPREPVPIGLRLVSEEDVQTARGEAAKLAWELHRGEGDADNRADAFNDALMRWFVARGTCRPGDISTPWFDCAEDTVRIALTSEGARWLYEQIERVHMEESPVLPEADDEQLQELSALLASGEAWAGLPLATARRARRMLAHVLTDILGR